MSSQKKESPSQTPPVEVKDLPRAPEELSPEEAEQVQGGSGKVKFNEFQIKKISDKASP